MSRCGHHHTNLYQASACEALHELAEEIGCSGVVGLVEVGEDGVCWPHISWRGNLTDAAVLVKGLCESIAAQPRPDDCEVCRRNHDLVKLALATLQDAGGRC